MRWTLEILVFLVFAGMALPVIWRMRGLSILRSALSREPLYMRVAALVFFAETVIYGGDNYHGNVTHAFETAPSFASAFSGGASNTTVIAHSLGNMVVCSAIQDHGFRPARYFMLNAAIPAEAFDATLGADYSASNSLVHPDWYDYDSRTWSARWHELFGSGDGRSKLTWRGRFADVADRTTLYNFHSGTAFSPGDEVLQIRDTPPSMLSDLHYEFPWTLDKGHYSWHKQEMGKGRLTTLNPHKRHGVSFYIPRVSANPPIHEWQ